IRPGRYEVSVYRNGEDTGTRKLELSYPERLTFRPPDQRRHTIGLILGVAGSVVFEAGVIMTVFAYSTSLSDCVGSNCDNTPGWLGPVGLGTLLVGGVTAPIGWLMFAN